MDVAEQREVYLPLPVEMTQFEEFCRKWQVAELAVFGSVLRPDFRPDSDVDLITRKSIERSHNWIRRKNILSSAGSIYVG